MAVRPLAPEEQRESGIKSGLVVQRAQGAAAAAGIREGDIILRVNGVRVGQKKAEQNARPSQNRHLAPENHHHRQDSRAQGGKQQEVTGADLDVGL